MSISCFFDRYGIHIQAFVDFVNGKLIVFQSSSPQTYFKNMYSISHKKSRNEDENTWYLVHTIFEHVQQNVSPRLTQIIFPG